MTDEERRIAHEQMKRQMQDERRATIRKQVEKVGNKGTIKPKSGPDIKGNKSSAVHNEGKDAQWKSDKRAKLHGDRLKRKNRAKTKAAPRGATKAAKNLARAGRLARGATGLGAAMEYGGLIADTMNPTTELDADRQRKLADLMRRGEIY